MEETEIDVAVEEEYYPPIGYGEKRIDGILYSVEEIYEGGVTILAVFAKKEALNGRSKEEITDFLVKEGILQINDTEYPQSELSFFYSSEEQAELFELDILLADEDFVYAECKLKLKYE